MFDIRNKSIVICGERIYLRRLTENDASNEYCDWLNDSEVNKYLETKKATINDLKKYIAEKNNDINCLFLGIFFKDNDTHIGNIKLEPIDFENKKATLGLLIGNKTYWGKGIGTEVVKLLVGWAFKNLELKEIELGAIADNLAAIKAYEKAGFRVDRIEKSKFKYGTNVHDVVHMIIKR